MTPGSCIGNEFALFSQGMPHSGMNIAGKNIANPTSILISSVMMLRYLGLPRFADQISNAINEVITSGLIKTRDIGGVNSTSEFTNAIIHELWSIVDILFCKSAKINKTQIWAFKSEQKGNDKNMFNPGIEPGTVCVLGRRDSHYTNWTSYYFDKYVDIIGNVQRYFALL